MLSTHCSAQELNTTPNANNLNPELNKFVGTWKWQENNKSFTIVLKKQNITLPPLSRNVKADIIYGYHQFIDNGLIIENSLDNISSTYNDMYFSISGGMGILGTNNTLKGNFFNISKNNKKLHFEIEYLDSTHIKLVSLKNAPGTKVVVGNQPDYDWSISLPQNIIFTKQ